MAEYIDREAAIKEIYRFDGYIDDDMEWRLHYALKKLPAADVVERAGWVRAAERMPELGPWETWTDDDGELISDRQTKTVLVIDKTGEMSLAEHRQEKRIGDERIRFDEWVSLPDLGTLKGVIWWAPTPEPPEEGT